MTEIRKEVHEEIDRMTDRDVALLKEHLASFPTRLAALHRNAPESDEPETRGRSTVGGGSQGMAPTERWPRDTT